jgi:hypothetical protein
MSLINEYRATEEAIKELQARLKNLSQDDKLQTGGKRLERDTDVVHHVVAEHHPVFARCTLDPPVSKHGEIAIQWP